MDIKDIIFDPKEDPLQGGTVAEIMEKWVLLTNPNLSDTKFQKLYVLYYEKFGKSLSDSFYRAIGEGLADRLDGRSLPSIQAVLEERDRIMREVESIATYRPKDFKEVVKLYGKMVEGKEHTAWTHPQYPLMFSNLGKEHYIKKKDIAAAVADGIIYEKELPNPPQE